VASFGSARSGFRQSECSSKMQYLRSKLFDISWGLWTLLFLPIILILILMGSPSSPIRVVSKIWSNGTILLLKVVVGLSYVERGIENIPHERCLIVSIHQSTWETLFYITKFPNAAVIAKSELLNIPVFGWYLKNYPMIVIDRDMGPKAIRQMIEGSRKAIRDDRPILIFPEGTRKGVLEAVSFRRGVELLYSDLNVPVLLIALNSGLFWGPAKAFKCEGIITVSYLPAILPGLPRGEFRRQAEKILDDEKQHLIAEVRKSK
jgi:1-acyl-sn-glycerol-3-phosphate acyltransferase